jgi:elongation factor Ts
MLKSAVLMARFSGSKVPLELVKQLRQQTNSPYSEVSRALQESGNDMEKALEWLKKKGLANA